MKGNIKLIAVLNSLLADELTSTNQYMVHSEMYENWGYCKLHTAISKQVTDEMNHAEWLIERIIFLDGLPMVSQLKTINIGKTIPEMIGYDYSDELKALQTYNDAIKLAREVKDQGTVDLLTQILNSEEDHIDWTEKQLAQIEQMGLENYLVNKT